MDSFNDSDNSDDGSEQIESTQSEQSETQLPSLSNIAKISESLTTDSKELRYIDRYGGCMYGIAIGVSLVGELPNLNYKTMFAKFNKLSVHTVSTEMPFCCLYALRTANIKYDKNNMTESLQHAIYTVLRRIVTHDENYKGLSRPIIRKDYLIKIAHYRSQKILQLLSEFDDMLYEKCFDDIARTLNAFAESGSSDEDYYILAYLCIIFGIYLIAVEHQPFTKLYELFKPYYGTASIAEFITMVYGAYGAYFGYLRLPIMPVKDIAMQINKEIQRIFSSAEAATQTS